MSSDTLKVQLEDGVVTLAPYNRLIFDRNYSLVYMGRGEVRFTATSDGERTVFDSLKVDP